MNEKPSIAPEIYRQRLLVEGYYECDVTRDSLSEFLTSLAEHLGLRTYGEPVVYSPVTGMGKSENAGFDAFVPLIDSGISAYVWSQAKFASILIYTCKGFDDDRAIAYCRAALELRNPIETKSF
jgi:S-adenosylmethionine/arginine decarboxylase-like enzyme